MACLPCSARPSIPAAVDALLYKNWYWWGLDMVADGNALIYTAGVWYLLIPLLTGRELFGANVVKTVIMVDLLVSMGVWSHHLLGDTSQPMVMRILSGPVHHLGRVLYHGPDHLCLADDRLAGATGQDDARPQVRPGLHVRLYDGRRGRPDPGQRGAEPGLSQHPVGRRPARPHLPADRRGHDALLRALCPGADADQAGVPAASA